MKKNLTFTFFSIFILLLTSCVRNQVNVFVPKNNQCPYAGFLIEKYNSQKIIFRSEQEIAFALEQVDLILKMEKENLTNIKTPKFQKNEIETNADGTVSVLKSEDVKLVYAPYDSQCETEGHLKGYVKYPPISFFHERQIYDDTVYLYNLLSTALTNFDNRYSICEIPYWTGEDPDNGNKYIYAIEYLASILEENK